MPTLDELRRLLARGIGDTKPRNIREGVDWDIEGGADHLDELTEEMLDTVRKTGVDVDKLRAKRSAAPSPPRFTKDTTGTDAIIGFGKHKGTSLRDIYKTDPTYLGWLLKEFRPLEDKVSKDFVDLVKLIIDGAPDGEDDEDSPF